MAKELPYSSGTDSSTNAQLLDSGNAHSQLHSKYEEQSTTIGFFPPTASQSPSFYFAKPEPAQDVSLFNTAEAKRPRVGGGGGGGSGGSVTSKKLSIPNGKAGEIIGKIPNRMLGQWVVGIGNSGERIKHHESGARIQVTSDGMVELTGSQHQIAKAEQCIYHLVLAEELGAQGIVSTPKQVPSEQFVMFVPDNKIGLIIGQEGETLKNMEARSGARIQVTPLHKVEIDGTVEQVRIAKQLLNEVAISHNQPPPSAHNQPQSSPLTPGYGNVTNPTPDGQAP